MTFIRQRVDNGMIMKKTLITLIIAHTFTATPLLLLRRQEPGTRGLNLAGRTTATPAPIGKSMLTAITSAAVCLPAIRLTPGWRVEGGYDYLGNMGINGRHGRSRFAMKSQGLQLSLRPATA